ncbi:hypothetical protein J5A73_02075 [Leptotrichia sp. oral taxon 218]|uniref:hypothetical protein n=1 Tax=Leptotrichia sp. oral taxon 218 TaxID=712361 RepID=UPI001B8D6A8E|nr:hypothetical protein [Leptotrichia sp. oral taxon 218]QUB95685.1 hypothetical protein J5A73_02075 [Leptotrichia sp. oral taxon 218]
MDIILEEDIAYKTKVNDFGVEPVNKRIITTGEKLIFFKKGIFEKEIGGKVKNSKIIKYIKEKNQLFVSSMFFVSTPNGKVYKCDGNKKKIKALVFETDKLITAMNFITSGRIVYIEDNTLFSYDVDTQELIFTKINKNKKIGNYDIFTSGENVIIKFREEEKENNIIYIFENKLKKIFEIKTENDHTYSKIVGIKYFAGTEEGEIEVWNILDKELYNSIKIADIKINYIEEDEEKFFIGLVDGTMIITDKDFKILRKEKVSDEEIQKICIIENEIYILISDKRIIKYRMINK